MGEVERMASRLVAARDRLRGAPLSDSRLPGPPDPKTGERWDRLNVLGHTAEMLPFWSREIRRALDSGDRMGREPGSAGRLEGIESGPLLGERALRDRIEDGTVAALGLLASLADEDLERELDTQSLGRVTLGHALEYYLVGHLEAHVGQLMELP